MYNTSFLCTYKLHDDEDDQDTLYRYEYLNAFNLKEYDSFTIIAEIENIFKKIKDNKHFIQIAESHYHFSKENKNHELILQFLFSFHTFDLFHKCLVYLLNDENDTKDENDVSDETDKKIYNMSYLHFIENKNLLIEEIKSK